MILNHLYFVPKVLDQQWMKTDELKRLQEKKLKAIINHAYRFVPFYRRKWKDLDLTPDDIKTVEDLKKLPVISREEIIKNYNSLIAVNYRNLLRLGRVVIGSTSGSTGAPFKILFDAVSWNYLEAIYLRSLLAAKYDPKKPLFYYWYEKFKKTLYNRLGYMRKIFVSSKTSEEYQLQLMQKTKPDYIYYFSSILYSIAKKILKEGTELRPKSVITHAEVLSKKMRKIIENAFDAPVFDQYGTTEFNRIAWVCSHNIGYHVDADSVILEAMDKDGEIIENGLGSAVLTGLVNQTLPLIRYEIGDIINTTDERCTCGRGLPLIKSIEGRFEDAIVINDKMYTPRRFIDLLADSDGIYKFRIYHKNGRLNCLIVPFDSISLKNVSESLQKITGKVSIKIVGEISKSKRGKRKLIGN